MIGIILALLAGFTFALEVILVRRLMNKSDFLKATVMITFVGNIVLWPLALVFTNPKNLDLEGVLVFVLAGILSIGIGRFVYFKSIEVVGASLSAPIFATYPLYSSIFAIVLLSDSISWFNWIGIISIVFGVFIIERSMHKSKSEKNEIVKKNLVLPISAALMIGSAETVRKLGLNISNEPLLGLAITYAAAFFISLVYLVLSNTDRSFTVLAKDFRLFWKAGIVGTVATLFITYALSYEKVSIVTPITQMETLFVFVLAYLFLKEQEQISIKLIVGALIIISGVIFVGIR